MSCFNLVSILVNSCFIFEGRKTQIWKTLQQHIKTAEEEQKIAIKKETDKSVNWKDLSERKERFL